MTHFLSECIAFDIGLVKITIPILLESSGLRLRIRMSLLLLE